jgi:hypothetical protein
MKHRREMPRVYTEPLLDKNEKPPLESHIDFTSPLRKDKEKPRGGRAQRLMRHCAALTLVWEGSCKLILSSDQYRRA